MGRANPDEQDYDDDQEQDLTRRQRKILDFYEEYLGRNGYAPSMREVAPGVGLSSASSVAYQLRQLEKLGRISLDARRSRSAVLCVSQSGGPGNVWMSGGRSYGAYISSPTRTNEPVNPSSRKATAARAPHSPAPTMTI